MGANTLSPRTYWAWRTVRDHGPLTSAEVHEHMHGMALDRVTMSLYNLVTGGYLRSIKRPGQRSRLFEVADDRAPGDVEALERQLQADPVFLRTETQTPSERPSRGPHRRRTRPGETLEPAEAFVPVQPEAPHHNHWVTAGAALSPRPPVVRPGSLDARRLPSLQFGRPRQGAETALGVVEAGARHA